eukprot:TRINITY_DN12435_c0_g1_i1.p1 TRINITY_DN12435_c0_g1~~TRINITY_DN12435_c0_g1_i1.p1  ORF type:complete len:610 (+),score=54.48 TRINITY_DN12435_c0_g1_i1:576-2405(+)
MIFVFDYSRQFWITFEVIHDTFFFLNLLHKFFVAYEKGSMRELETSWSMLALRYLKRDFLLDVVAIIPFYLISERLILLKMLTFLQMKSIGTLVQRFISKVLRFSLKDFKGISYSLALASTVKRGFIILYIGHILNCFWVVVSQQKDDHVEDSWITLFRPKQFFDTYIYGYYYVITTCVGIGASIDILERTSYEMWFTMAMQLIGIGIFAWGISNLRYEILKVHLDDDNEKEDALLRWLSQRWVGAKLRNHLGSSIVLKKVKEYLSFCSHFQVKSIFDDSRFQRVLSSQIRTPLLNYIFERVKMRFSSFFSELKDDCANEIALNLIPISYPQFSVIIPNGTIPTAIFFILQGKVILKTGDMKTGHLSKGSIFGLSSLVDRPVENDYVISDEKENKLLIIPIEQIKAIKERYPNGMVNLTFKAIEDDAIVQHNFPQFITFKSTSTKTIRDFYFGSNTTMMPDKSPKFEEPRTSIFNHQLGATERNNSFTMREILHGDVGFLVIQEKEKFPSFLDQLKELGPKNKRKTMDPLGPAAVHESIDLSFEPQEEEKLDDSFEYPIETEFNYQDATNDLETFTNYLQEATYYLKCRTHQSREALKLMLKSIKGLSD